jgi:hypothetical protein
MGLAWLLILDWIRAEDYFAPEADYASFGPIPYAFGFPFDI